LSKDKSHLDTDIIERIATPPPVHFTSIYSKTDGVVAWESSQEDGPLSENIEILYASHLGLGYNPRAMSVVADRLVQPKYGWVKYS
jgi:hypothetical protein